MKTPFLFKTSGNIKRHGVTAHNTWIPTNTLWAKSRNFIYVKAYGT